MGVGKKRGEEGAVEGSSKKEAEQLRNSRLSLLRQFVDKVRLKSVLQGDDSVGGGGSGDNFQLYCKTFYSGEVLLHPGKSL